MNASLAESCHFNRLGLSLWISAMACLISSCTPFKLDDYKECESNSDCRAGFERCDLNNFCVSQGSTCYWHISGSDVKYDYTPQADQAVIGVLANLEEVAPGGSRWSGIVGLQTGAYTVLGPEAPPLAMIICDSAEIHRTEALEVFSREGAKTVIARPLPMNVIPDTRAYISIGLDDLTEEESRVEPPSSGWLNLRPPKDDLHRAFEYVSNRLLEWLNSYERPFTSILSLQDRQNQPRFINNIIWRLSPYENSLFRTLMVYFDQYFNIDSVITEFLQQHDPLSYFVSFGPTESSQINTLIDEAISQSTIDSQITPLSLLALMWDVNEVIELSSLWPYLVKFTVIYGQYNHETNDPEISRIYEEAATNLMLFDRQVILPTPYFGLAFDAGVLAVLIHKLSSSEPNIHTVLNSLQASAENDTGVPFTADRLSQAFMDSNLEGEQWRVINRPLIGLSGPIINVSGTENNRSDPMLICAYNLDRPRLIPLTRLETPVIKDLDLMIKDYFSLDLELLSACEPQ